MIDIYVVRAQKTFEVNQLSVLVWTAAAVKAGLHGSVINVSSIGGFGVEPNIGWVQRHQGSGVAHHEAALERAGPDVRRTPVLGWRRPVGCRSLGKDRRTGRGADPVAPIGPTR